MIDITPPTRPFSHRCAPRWQRSTPRRRAALRRAVRAGCRAAYGLSFRRSRRAGRLLRGLCAAAGGDAGSGAARLDRDGGPNGRCRLGRLWRHYMGTFAAPVSRYPAHRPPGAYALSRVLPLRGRQVVEMQAIWDIPEVMMQAGAWPMAPQLGGSFRAGPRPDDAGRADRQRDGQRGRCRVSVVVMLRSVRHPGTGTRR